VGLDYSLSKTVFASRALPWARLVCGDAIHLPFRDGAFDRVFCRDVLHHLALGLQRSALEEFFRVCRSGGEVVVIEPNGRNFLIGAFALLIAAERGMLRSTPRALEALIRSVESRVSIEMAQPLPVARILLHYRMGFPRLGRWRSVAGMLRGIDAVLMRLMPPSLWAYIILRGHKSTVQPQGT
jgi:ubiquinone/menaquinone biosynthesis C-methylase UbiE